VFAGDDPEGTHAEDQQQHRGEQQALVAGEREPGEDAAHRGGVDDVAARVVRVDGRTERLQLQRGGAEDRLEDRVQHDRARRRQHEHRVAEPEQAIDERPHDRDGHAGDLRFAEHVEHVGDERVRLRGAGVAHPREQRAVAGEGAVCLNHDPPDRHEREQNRCQDQRPPAVPQQPAVERQQAGAHRGRMAEALWAGCRGCPRPRALSIGGNNACGRETTVQRPPRG
jgi:hypothetical protein